MENTRFIPFHPKMPPPGWKCLKRFKGLLWESNDSEESDSEREIDNLLIIALQQYKEKERSEQKLVMVSQQHEKIETRQKDKTGNISE